LEAGEAEWAGLQESIVTRNRHLESCGEARAAATALVNTAKNRIAALQSHARTIGDRYPDGIDEAESRAQLAFVEAKAQFDVARAKMPEDWEKLGLRHDRALRSAEQAAKDFHDLRRDVQKLETILEQAGSQGLYSRETRLVEALARADAERIRLETRAWAARFLAGLIDSRKKAAVSTVLKPLEDRLSATFAEITGNRSRRVFLDESLQVSGIGPDRNASYPFTQLSQGAREQLLLALRAAVALELTQSGPQILILDDVLVHTDAARQEHVLDFIGAIAESLQVLVVTCHPEQYQGLGTQLDIRD
jgi:DNA repair protein SbcC/Rad50